MSTINYTNSIRAWHLTFAGVANTTQTIQYNCRPYKVLVKNMTDSVIIYSWGPEILNPEYVEIPANCAELVEFDLPRTLIDFTQATVKSSGTGYVEIRVIDD